MKEFRDLLVTNKQSANVLLHGVPFDGNYSINAGAKHAPDKLRELSWWLPAYSMDGEPLSHIRIYDEGNFELHSFADIERAAKGLFCEERFHLIFGGDHSISIPFQKDFIEKAKAKGKIPVIVHIDAHCDICDVYLGSKHSHACTVRRALDNGLEEDNLFMIGIREFEKDGYDYLINRKNDVHLYKASEVLSKGLGRFLKEVAEKNDDRYEIYVSFDIDSLDSAYAPGTGTPETCGLTPYIVRDILRTLGSFPNVRCLDVVEVAPPLDSNDITGWAALKLVYEFLAVRK